MIHSKSKIMVCKTVIAGAVAIGLCSMTFIGVNNTVLASEMSKEVSVPTVYNLKPVELKTSEDYVKSDYRVVENKLSPSSDKNALSAEDAAEIGVQYIWDMYKKDLKGKVLFMSYNISPITSETRWLGYVFDEYDNTTNISTPESPVYSFMINAITGERQSLQYKYEENDNAKEPIIFNQEKSDKYYKDNCAEYLKLAAQFAKKSYGIEVSAKEFGGVSALLVKTDLKTLKSHPKELPASRLYINVKVTDTDGRQYEVSITEDTKELQSIIIIEPDQGGSNYLG